MLLETKKMDESWPASAAAASSAVQVVKAAMIHAERTRVDLSGPDKSKLVAQMLRDVLETLTPAVRQQVQVLLWSEDTLLQPTMDVIVEAAKGRLPTSFSRNDDDVDDRTRKAVATAGVRVHRWSAYAMGY